MYREQNGEYRYYGALPQDAQQRLDQEHRDQERAHVEPPRPAWSPGPAPGVQELSPFLPPLPQAPPAEAVVPVDVSQVTWQPTNAETAAVIQALNAPQEMFAAPPPAHVGDNPSFDAFFDKLAADTASTQAAAMDALLSIEPTQPGFF
ncbi:hypothetical protein ACFVZ4_29935 [Streptomyces goshikiensis]|uniref:hypothetical protein n=1 Tax=Streptomyces goshikiensis TaxID=1942 RepID=UPI0036936E2E